MLAFRNQNVDDITSCSDNREGFKWLSEIIENNNNNMFPIDSVYNSIVDYNAENKAIIYESTLGRELGLEITQGDHTAVVSSITQGSKADKIGIQVGDAILAISATAGETLWTHKTEESVKANLATRFVMNSTVKIRFERKLSSIPENTVSILNIPYFYEVKLKRPIGLHVLEGPNKKVYIQEIKPDQGAARIKRIEIGDQIVAMSASWGDRLWEVNSVESFVVGVKMRTDSHLTLKLRRTVALMKFVDTANNKFDKMNYRKKIDDDKSLNNINSTSSISKSFSDQLEECHNVSDLNTIWDNLKANKFIEVTLENYSVNKIMLAALKIEKPDMAVKIFEEIYGYHLSSSNPAKNAMNPLSQPDTKKAVNFPKGSWEKSELSSRDNNFETSNKQLIFNQSKMIPNNFVVTTAIKAYGRCNDPASALGLLSWFESISDTKQQQQPSSSSSSSSVSSYNDPSMKPDIYLMTSLLYVCAKEKLTKQAEDIFWNEIPNRNLKYTVATTNSLMYMYARLNRPDDVLRVYELTKSLDIKCSVVTFGVLIKALIKSNKKQLESTAYEILTSLPSMGITPGIEIYNQFLEHYANTDNYKQSKRILSLMAESKPKVKPNQLSYGYLITCYSNAKKPRSALAIYHQMKKARIEVNGYVYMGVLKSLALMRDGMSAVQVITEMKDLGIQPDKRHISMAMFACVISETNNLAESLLALYVRMGGVPDTALYTLLLRSLLQQKKWNEGYALLKKMSDSRIDTRPNFITLNYVLKAQVAAERYDEAKEILRLILNAVSLINQEQLFEEWQGVTKTIEDLEAPQVVTSVLPRISARNINIKNVSPQSVLSASAEALSLALGSYSQFAQRVQKDDIFYKTKSINQNSMANMNFNLNNNENNAMQGVSASQTSFSWTDFGLMSDIPALSKPSHEALEFLVDCASMIATQDGALLFPDFYMELLKALSTEGSSELTSTVLDIGKSNKLRVKNDNMIKFSKIEELARRSIQGKRLATSGTSFTTRDLLINPYQGQSVKRPETNDNKIIR